MRNFQVHVCAKEDMEHEPEWRPDGCWSWLACAASGTSVVIVAGIGYSFGLVLSPLMETFKATWQETGK